MRHDPAIAALSQADPTLGTLIARVGPCLLVPREDEPAFESLAKAIVYQQLSTKAADTIYGRFSALFPEGRPHPERLLAMDELQLRQAGISRQKQGYLRDLASRVPGLPLDALEGLDDEAIIRELTAVKGIGRWTVQMLLLFRMGRPDVLPELDLGIQKGIMQVYGLAAMPKPKEVLAIGERWRPHRSIASWYLWRSLEL